MRDDLRTLLRLQELDIRARDLRQEREAQDAAIASLREEIAEKERAAAGERERVLKERSKIKEIDLQIEEKKGKIVKFEQQLLQIKNNKEYQALLHEIAGIRADIRMLEEKDLLVMEEEEEEAGRLEEEKRKIADSRKRLEEAEAKARQEFSRIEGDQAAVAKNRKVVEAALDPDLHDKYDRIFRNKPHRALVAVVNDSCQGCNMRLTAQILNDLHKDERILYCENCGRLIYLPEKS
jgi:hypothetical protein